MKEQGFLLNKNEIFCSLKIVRYQNERCKENSKIFYELCIILKFLSDKRY